MKSREDSQDSRMCLKQGRKCRTNSGHLVLFAYPCTATSRQRAWAIRSSQRCNLPLGLKRHGYMPMAKMHLLLFLRGYHELFLASVSRDQLKYVTRGHTLSPSFPVQLKCQPSSPLPQELPQGLHDADHSLFMHLFSREIGSRVNQTLLSALWLRELACFGTSVCGCSHDSITLPDLCKTRTAESSPLFLSHPRPQFIEILLSRHSVFIKTNKKKKLLPPVDIT